MTKPSKFPRFSYLDAQPRQRRPAQLPLIVTTYRRYRRWTDDLQWNGSGQSGTHEGFRRRYGRYPYLKSGMYPLRMSGDTPTITPRRQSPTPPFHSQTTTRSPIPPFAFGDTRRYRVHLFDGRIKYENKCSHT